LGVLRRATGIARTAGPQAARRAAHARGGTDQGQHVDVHRARRECAEAAAPAATDAVPRRHSPGTGATYETGQPILVTDEMQAGRDIRPARFPRPPRPTLERT